MYQETDRWQELRDVAVTVDDGAGAVKNPKPEDANAWVRRIGFNVETLTGVMGGFVALYLFSWIAWPQAAVAVTVVGLLVGLLFLIVAPVVAIIAGVFTGVFCPKTVAKLKEQERLAEKALEEEEALMCPLKKAEKEEEERRRRAIIGYGAIM